MFLADNPIHLSQIRIPILQFYHIWDLVDLKVSNINVIAQSSFYVILINFRRPFHCTQITGLLIFSVNNLYGLFWREVFQNENWSFWDDIVVAEPNTDQK